jgi:hypothetical protein
VPAKETENKNPGWTFEKTVPQFSRNGGGKETKTKAHATASKAAPVFYRSLSGRGYPGDRLYFQAPEPLGLKLIPAAQVV